MAEGIGTRCIGCLLSQRPYTSRATGPAVELGQRRPAPCRPNFYFAISGHLSARLDGEAHYQSIAVTFCGDLSEMTTPRKTPAKGSQL